MSLHTPPSSSRPISPSLSLSLCVRVSRALSPPTVAPPPPSPPCVPSPRSPADCWEKDDPRKILVTSFAALSPSHPTPCFCAGALGLGPRPSIGRFFSVQADVGIADCRSASSPVALALSRWLHHKAPPTAAAATSRTSGSAPRRLVSHAQPPVRPGSSLRNGRPTRGRSRLYNRPPARGARQPPR